MSDALAPTARYLRGRAAHYRELAARERNAAKAADYLDRARILETAAEPTPQIPAQQADIDQAEGHVREGEERVGRQLALVERLQAAGRHDESRKAQELLGTLTEALNTAKRHLQIIRGARNRNRR